MSPTREPSRTARCSASRRTSKPLEFLVGGGTLIPTLENGMLGMKVGEKKSITVKAADAYGEYDKAAVREVPRDQFPKDLELKVGEQYQVNGQGGPMVVTVSALTAGDGDDRFQPPPGGKGPHVRGDDREDPGRDEGRAGKVSAAAQAAPRRSSRRPMALRLFLTSDLHLGMKFAGYPDAPRAALVEARFTCLDRVVAAANEARKRPAGDRRGPVRERECRAPDILRAAKSLGAFRGRLAAVLAGKPRLHLGGRQAVDAVPRRGGRHLLLLDYPRPYPLAGYDLDACLYPGPCTVKHSASNAIGWVRAAPTGQGSPPSHRYRSRQPGGPFPGQGRAVLPHAAAGAHGQRGTALADRPHPPALSQGARTEGRRFSLPGTPEPDGFDCTHDGSAWALDLRDDGTVAARSLATGELRFVDEGREVHSHADLERLERDLAGGAPRHTLLRLRLTGRAPRETLDEIDSLQARLSAGLLHLDLRADQLREEITREAIDREYPAGSFPHTLLSDLAREDDQEALQIAHDFLQELKS